VILEGGMGPKEVCGYCGGSGVITNRKAFFRTLGFISGERRRRLVVRKLKGGA